MFTVHLVMIGVYKLVQTDLPPQEQPAAPSPPPAPSSPPPSVVTTYINTLFSSHTPQQRDCVEKIMQNVLQSGCVVLSDQAADEELNFTYSDNVPLSPLVDLLEPFLHNTVPSVRTWDLERFADCITDKSLLPSKLQSYIQKLKSGIEIVQKPRKKATRRPTMNR